MLTEISQLSTVSHPENLLCSLILPLPCQLTLHSIRQDFISYTPSSHTDLIDIDIIDRKVEYRKVCTKHRRRCTDVYELGDDLEFRVIRSSSARAALESGNNMSRKYSIIPQTWNRLTIQKFS